jgi:hypothetical protein
VPVNQISGEQKEMGSGQLAGVPETTIAGVYTPRHSVRYLLVDDKRRMLIRGEVRREGEEYPTVEDNKSNDSHNKYDDQQTVVQCISQALHARLLLRSHRLVGSGRLRV